LPEPVTANYRILLIGTSGLVFSLLALTRASHRGAKWPSCVHYSTAMPQQDTSNNSLSAATTKSRVMQPAVLAINVIATHMLHISYSYMTSRHEMATGKTTDDSPDTAEQTGYAAFESTGVDVM
jgi:hypothetical protein